MEAYSNKGKSNPKSKGEKRGWPTHNTKLGYKINLKGLSPVVVKPRETTLQRLVP